MKKLFHLATLATIASLAATISVATSCSDDEEEETPVVVDTTNNNGGISYERFELTVGGPKSDKGSYISIQNKKALMSSQLNESSGVEIVFDGYGFKGAQNSTNNTVSSIGLNAEIETVEPGKLYRYKTNGADYGNRIYFGSIEIVNGTVGSDDAVVDVIVYREYITGVLVTPDCGCDTSR